ncbi:tripartite motif-containing protein 2 [Patella vulgata]|uniref:tripartite motif-containing protein 2 n=1 Tax=Patella vulgata TaxID=6465 RepID=UPI00218025D7|nr:tripartite motif-containing protein 2 [Patella vulgata]XP_050407794.1 tripartite motif-containing protein 2 [Patella vulgata]XP_050407795.1 tripartite motif-containing protein 2 [Patella vulgata]XP_050407796.1 tripartite motif-containing protein 2 [Patella vulgata]XP_050407797.1 tripartite motif-containing protein 2 [Patella vulgata]XP_050407798.1 tripartite motif-containing protein 2 [Patella vulgata]XP_050407799.1 tripartite motif-containing protein 2 [Patella vulgata]XP_050407800.1 tri
MTATRTVRFADDIDEICEINEIIEIQPKFSGRITMAENGSVSNRPSAFEEIVQFTEPSEPLDENEIDTSPRLSENTSVKFDYNEEHSNGFKINFGKKFGTKGSGYGQLQDATDVVSLSHGNILVSDMVNSKLQVFNERGSPTVAYVLDELIEPRGIITTSEGYIAATSRKIKAVTILSPDGRLVGTFGQNILSGPSGIDVDCRGNFIISDIVTNRVSVVDKNGNFIQHVGKNQSFNQPRYVTVSKNGEIIVSDSGNNCLKIFDSNGLFIRQIGKFGKNDGCLKVPYATSTDSFGNILVSDHYNDRVSVFSSTGRFLRHIVTSAHGISHPAGLALSSDMVLYVTHGGLKANQVAAFELNFDGLPCNVVAYV